jgi:hypothetical protein
MTSPDFSHWNPQEWVIYGPEANCTLELCPISATIFEYRPSLAANVSFIVLFGVSFFIHLYQGTRSKKWTFMIANLLGCAIEMIGYGGRVMMWKNPWSFVGFIMQIGELVPNDEYKSEDAGRRAHVE